MVRFQMSLYSVKTIDHVTIHTWCIALAVFSQLCAVIFWSLTRECRVPNAVFQTSSWTVSKTFSLDVTMDWWSENNWIMADIWSTAWLMDAIVKRFKRNVLGPVSCNPEIHCPFFYLLWSMANCSRICSMVLWDIHNILGATIFSWTLPAFSFYMLYMSYKNLNRYKPWLAINNPDEISWIRYLTQNGLALFAWWTLLNAMVDLGVVLKYHVGIHDPQVSTFILTMVLLSSLIWFILQTFMFRDYMSYTFTVYPVLVLCLGAMFTRSYYVKVLTGNSIYCGFIMLLMVIMSLTQLVLTYMCPKKASGPLSVEPGLMYGNLDIVCLPDCKEKQSSNQLKN